MLARLIYIMLLVVFCAGITIAQHPEIAGYKVFYGHLHNHSSLSDGVGSPTDAYNYAKNTAHLDFFGLSDHSEYLTPEEWDSLKNITYNFQDTDFVAFYGFEWTNWTYGHVAVIGTTNYCIATDSLTDTFLELNAWLNNQTGFAFFNHPGLYSMTNEFYHFSSQPNDKFIGIELWNKSVGFSYFYYNDGYYNNDNGLSFYDEANSRGWKIGAAGSDDNHSGTWGTNNDFRLAILADTLLKDSLMRALENRNFFSTLDKNVALSFTANGHQMGSEIQQGITTFFVEAFDMDSEIISNISIYKSGHLIKSWSPETEHPVIEFDTLTVKKEYFYVKITEADGDEAISSPIFVIDTATTGNISDKMSEILVNPNPAQGFVNIKIPGNTLPCKLKIYGVDGVLMYYNSFNCEEFRVDIKGFTPGVYMLIIDSPKGIFEKKLIKN